MASGKAIDPETCKHDHPHADVAVRHFPDLKRQVAVVRLTCLDCGTPFAFVGPSKAEGYSLEEPVVDDGRLELRAPLEPAPWRTANSGLIVPGRIIGGN